MSSSLLLLSGCESLMPSDFCELSGPMKFASLDVIRYLNENDDTLLRTIVGHNTLYEELCHG